MNLRNFLKTASLFLSVLPASLLGQTPRLVDMTFYAGDQPVRETSYGPVLVELTFDREMDASVAPEIHYSLDGSYNMNFSASGDWIDSFTWEGSLSITNFEPASEDGEYQFRVQKAKADNGFEMAQTFSVDLNTTLFICRTGKISISPSSVDFGNNPFGSKQVRRLAVYNESCANLSIRSISSSTFFQIVGNYNNTIVAPGDSLEVFVEFTPPVRVLVSGSVTIESNDRNNRELSVPVHAGALGPGLSLSTKDINFGDVPINESRKLNLVVTNENAGNPAASQTLFINGIETSLPDAFSVTPSLFSLAPGGQRTVEITFAPKAFANYDSVRLSITHNDSSRQEDIVLIRGNGIDILPPQAVSNLQAVFTNHDGLTSADSLQICWQNPPEQSGVAEVFWKLTQDNAPPQDANDTTLQGGRAALADSQTCVYLPLRDRLTSGRWNLYVWLTDGSGNSGYQNAVRTSFTYDLLSPAKPENISRIIPATSWFNASRPFLISFSIPVDAVKNFSDAAEVRYKFLTPPVSASDSSGSLPIARPHSGRGTATIPFNSDTLCGVGSVYFWFADSAGNSNHAAFESFEYRFDGCAPTVQVLTDSAAATVGSRHENYARITDISAVDSVWALYRLGGRTSQRDSILATRVAGTDSFMFRIPGESVTRRGLEVAVIATDTLGNQSAAPQDTALCASSGWSAVTTRMDGEGDAPLDEDGMPMPLTAGFDTLKYQLFSVPHTLDSPGVLQVLEDDLDVYNDTFWRIFDFVPQNAEDLRWQEGVNSRPFAPGRAYFLISRNAERFVDSGPATTVATVCPFQIRVYDGWNLFGLPFNFNVADTVLSYVNARQVGGVYGFNDGWQVAGQLEPWKGYAVFVERAGTSRDPMYLTISPYESQAATAKTRSENFTNAPGEWRIKIQAKSGSQKDSENFLGVKFGAHEGFDEFEQIEPPVVQGFVSLAFERSEWEASARYFSTDFRPVEDDAEAVWNFQVQTGRAASPVELAFEVPENFPKNRQLYLVDETAKIAQNLLERSGYTIPTSKSGGARTLKIVVGDRDFVEQTAGEIALVPEQFALMQNYPNPFNPETAIRYNLPKSATVSLIVFDQLGRRIRGLINGEQQTAGYFTEIWDGRDDLGNAVASGVYFYRLITPEGAISKKMILLK